MSETKKIEFLIIGQGIAGTILAHKLLEKGKTVQIIDNGHISSSSLIAGGISHPMSFKRTILSWKADSLIPIAKQFYTQFENKYCAKVFEELPMARIFGSIEEQNNWQGRMADTPMNSIIEDGNFNFSDYDLKYPFGMGEVNHAGRLDVGLFLKLSHQYFSERKVIQKEAFVYDSLIFEEQVRYKNWKPKYIVFCEGYKMNQNPYFNYIPLNPTKGEILIIKTKELPSVILSQGCFVMPIGDDKYVLGATYDRKNINQETSLKGKEELIEKLRKIGNFDFEIIEHKAGVRPTTHDRRPILGRHPKMNQLFLFNGLGSKGVMLAPYFADELIENILTQTSLNSEVDIARYSKKHLHKCPF